MLPPVLPTALSFLSFSAETTASSLKDGFQTLWERIKNVLRYCLSKLKECLFRKEAAPLASQRISTAPQKSIIIPPVIKPVPPLLATSSLPISTTHLTTTHSLTISPAREDLIAEGFPSAASLTPKEDRTAAWLLIQSACRAHLAHKETGRRRECALAASMASTGTPLSLPTFPLVSEPMPIVIPVGGYGTFITRFVDTFRDIAYDYHNRRESLRRGEMTVLEKGPWYAIDYMTSLKEIPCMAERFEHLKQKNAFYHHHCPEGFIPLTISCEPYALGFQIAPGIAPMAALASIRNGPFSFFDCGMSIQLALYLTIAAFWGEELFNHYFSGRLLFCPEISKTPLQTFLQDMRRTDSSAIAIGDIVHVKGAGSYLEKHPIGHMGGFNAVCTIPQETERKEMRFIAFGAPHPVGGCSEVEMVNCLIDAYNEPPLDLSLFLTPKFLTDAPLPKNYDKPNTYRLKRIQSVDTYFLQPHTIHRLWEFGQAMVPGCYRLDIPKIERVSTQFREGEDVLGSYRE